MSDLDDVLNDKQPDPVEKPEAVAPVEKPAVEAAEKPVSSRQQWREKEEAARRDPDTGKFVAKEKAEGAPEESHAASKEEKPAPPKQDLTDKERAFLRAMEEERGKRQKLEREFAELQQRIAAATPPPPKPDLFGDPEGYQKAQDEKESRLRAEMEQNTVKTKLEVSEIVARQRYPDFQEKATIFAQMVQAQPALYQQLVQQFDPAEFAYKTAKAAMDQYEWQQSGGAEGMRKKVEAEIRAKIEAELKEKQAESEKQRQALPGSLSNVSGLPGKRTWTGPPSLDDILSTIKH